jgi:purine catabolism regulator
MTVVARGGMLVLLIAAATPEEAAAHAKRLLRDCAAARVPLLAVGLGRECRRPSDYAVSFAEAVRAVQAAGRLPGLPRVVPFALLDYHQLVLGARPGPEVLALARSCLEPLMAHDAGSRRGALVPTLGVYLDACGNLEATARRLGVHPNTLRLRIARIQELTGRDLQLAATRLDFALALAALDLSGSTDL